MEHAVVVFNVEIQPPIYDHSEKTNH